MNKSLKWFLIVAFGFCLGILPPAVCPAMQAYELSQNLTGTASSTVIFLQNLSPYPIKLTAHNVSDPVTDSSQSTVLVPLGFPTALPATVYPSCTAVAYTSPMVPMVVNFQDYNSPIVNLFQLDYLISQVTALDNQGKPVTADVPFRLYVSHTVPPAPERGSMHLLWNLFKEALSITDVILDPESKIGWIALAADTYDLIDDAAFPDGNKNTSSPSNPNTIAAYAVMDFTKETPSVFTTDGSLQNTDAIATQAGGMSAPANGIIVTVSTVRGKWGTTGADVMPYTFVTVYDTPHFTAASLSLAIKDANKAGTLKADPATAGMAARMQKSGRVAILEIANALKGFSPQQYAAVNSAIAKIRGGKALASEEAAILNDLGTRADKLILARATDCPSGACTMPDKTCTQTKQLDCKGTYQGDGTTCPTGACFKDANTCTTLTQVACKAISGATYKGDNTSCPTGGCYYQSTQNCDANLTQDACIAKNGSYMGNYTDCGKGACYLQDNCSITYGGLCTTPSIYHGTGTVCGAVMSVSPVYFGAKKDPAAQLRGYLANVQNPFAALTFSNEDYLMSNTCTGPMLSCGFGIMMDATKPLSTTFTVSDGKKSFDIKATWGMDLPQTSFTASASKKKCQFAVPVNYSSGVVQVAGGPVVVTNTCSGSQGDSCVVTLQTSEGSSRLP